LKDLISFIKKNFNFFKNNRFGSINSSVKRYIYHLLMAAFSKKNSFMLLYDCLIYNWIIHFKELRARLIIKNFTTVAKLLFLVNVAIYSLVSFSVEFHIQFRYNSPALILIVSLNIITFLFVGLDPNALPHTSTHHLFRNNGNNRLCVTESANT